MPYRYAASTKSAIVCIGAQEMWKFCTTFFTGVEVTTFLENCGLGDLVVASIAGRNRKVAEAFVTAGKVSVLRTKVGSFNWLRVSLLSTGSGY